MKRTITISLLLLTSLGAFAQETVYALTESNALVSFKTNATGTLLSNVMISGMPTGVKMVGIDIRPDGGGLYGAGTDSRIYTINRLTGAASAVGTGFGAISGNSFGFDFNPTVDRIRLVSDADQNLRLNPITGGLAATDMALKYKAGDANFGVNPMVGGAAYTNNFKGATTTSLYGIDAMTDSLVLQAPPNDGTLTTIGALGSDTNEWIGFDISGFTGNAYCSLTTPGVNVQSSNFFRMNLATGAASFVGTIGSGDCDRILGLTVVPEPGSIIGLGLSLVLCLRRRSR